MAAGGDRRRRHFGVPGRPWLGHRGAVRPGPGPAGPDLYAPRRLPARRGGVRRGFLRNLTARGTRDRPAATAVVADGVGGVRTGGHRPGLTAGKPDGCLHRDSRPRLCRGISSGARRAGRLRAHRRPEQRRLGPDLLHPRAGGPDDDAGHGLLLVTGGPASRGAVTTLGRVRPGAGRRRHGHDLPTRVHRVRPAAWPGTGREMQGVRRRGGRYRLGRRRRAAAAGTPQ